MTAEEAGEGDEPRGEAKAPITKTAMFKTPYHHIKGVFAAEKSGEFRLPFQPGHIACREIWLN
jgi:hypothetical protein